jgi:hypothetical protein
MKALQSDKNILFLSVTHYFLPPIRGFRKNPFKPQRARRPPTLPTSLKLRWSKKASVIEKDSKLTKLKTIYLSPL